MPLGSQTTRSFSSRLADAGKSPVFGPLMAQQFVSTLPPQLAAVLAALT